MNKNILITIIGPTAIGKTSLSIALAQHFGCDIISCDSRQFFKEMSIGTAVPSKEELAAAPHHFIQNKSIFENYSVGDFEKEALEKLNELFTKNNIQIMVGGSGLYVDAVLKGFDEFPNIDESVRTEINSKFEELGIEFLQEKLQQLDIEYYKKLEAENPQTLQNPQRMKRFVEVCIGTALPYSSFIGKRKNERNFTPIIIGLEADREIMYNRINQRVDIMLELGLLDEAQNLFPHKERNALQTVGYRELFDYFDGETTFEFAIEQIKQNTRRFAKRQMTWFKRTENATWFDFETDRNEIIQSINSKSKIVNRKSQIVIKMPVSPDFTSIYTQNFEIGFQHCYPNGSLKHTEICNLFQIVAGIHADLGGISYLDMQQHHQAWVLSRMRIEITKLPKWKDVITIKTWIKTLENSRSIRCLEMYLNEEKIVGCETFWVVINTKTRRPDILALPHTHFEKFDTDSILNPIQKINIPEVFTFKNDKTIQLSDIDIVNHANNVKYLEWCLDVTNMETVLSNKIKTLNLNYIQELNFNDAIEIHHTTNSFLITKDGKSCFALEVEL